MDTSTITAIETVEDLRYLVQGFADELVGFEDHFGEDQSDETITLVEEWIDTLVEMDWLTNRHGDIVRIDLVRSMGGPNVWAEIDSAGWVDVHGSWGGSRHLVRADVPALTEFLTELAEAAR